MTAHHNNWDTSAQWSESSSSITSSSNTEIVALKAEMAKINKNLMRVLQVNQQVKAYTSNFETCGGPHSFFDCPATVGNTQNVYAEGAYQGIKETIIFKGTTMEETNSSKELTKVKTTSSLSSSGLPGSGSSTLDSSATSGTLPSNTITNPKEDLKGITTRSGNAYQGPTIPTSSSLPPVIECETEATKDTVHPTNNGSTKDVQPPVVQTESLILNSELVVSPIIEPIASRDLNFNICFADALILMPKFGPSIKSLLTNKDKLWDPGKFLIPCDFPRMAECLALADLGASINLIPLSVWNKLSLPDLFPTCMTLELADRSISHLVGVAEDVFVKLGTFHFSADFVVVDFDADPRVPLVLGRTFLKTKRALIDVFEGELTLSVGKEAITFNINQTSRYSANYNEMTINRINVIDMDCEDDFLLEEVDAFLALEDNPTSTEVDQSYVDTKGDILLFEAFLNDDPSLPPQNQGNYLPEVCDNKLPVIIAKDLSVEEKTALITVHTSEPLLGNSPISRQKTTFNYPYGTFAYRCMPFGLYNAPGHFMVKEGIVLGHKISKEKIKVDKAKVEVITKLPHPTTVKESFQTLKRKLTEAPILITPDWDIPFELMCDASDFAIGAVLGQCQEKHFRPIYYASKTMTEAESSYTITEKEMLAVVEEAIDILKACHYGPTKGHHRLNYTANKVEAKALPTNDARVVCKFLKNLFTRFGTAEPLSVIEERPSVMTRENHASWSDKLDDALWAFRTAYKTTIGCTPYKLVYGKACHLPIELEHKAYWALKHANFNLQTAGDHRKVQLNELRNQAYENSPIYKEKTKRLHDSKIKYRVFNIGDRVLIFISRLKIFSGKLKSRWSGPFTISHVFLYGTVELSQPDGPNFKVNGYKLKRYFGEDVPKMVIPDLQTYPKDH
nr:reverse transcriptase domain-containing protein [Tanacetum cinerariifolium]